MMPFVWGVLLGLILAWLLHKLLGR